MVTAEPSYIINLIKEEKMEYSVITTSDPDLYKAIDELVIRVQRLCNEGYKPQGGISIAASKNGWVYASQAMVK